MFYPIKTPWWLTQLYPHCTWKMPSDEKAVYLSFDDGPDPDITPFVLEQLAQYGVKATFFCIGKNVAAYPEIYARILAEGHRTGNHTQHHLNGWKVGDEAYLKDVFEAGKLIDSNLFRPPYGKATYFQMKCLRESSMKLRMIMWTVLSGDFDPAVTPEQCFKNVSKHLVPGSIITFHDSRKAAHKIRYALPEVLKRMKEENLSGKSI